MMILQEYSHNPEKVQSELVKRTFYLAVLPLLITLIYDYRIFLGYFLGLLVSLLLLKLKLINIKRALEMGQGRAISFIRRRFFLEYVLIFIGLMIAYHNALLNVWGMAAGLIMLKLTVIICGVIETIKDFRSQRDCSQTD